MRSISTTSALVLLWAEGFYRSPAARAYLSKLDLSPGLSLYRSINGIFGEYAEVIKNRKFGTVRMIDSAVRRLPAPPQLIFAGAGLDAMGVEVAQSHPSCPIFELDLEQMELKSELLSDTDIKFITAELKDGNSAGKALLAAGWRPSRPSVLILEGITYYLTRGQLADLVHAVAPRYVVAEYLKPRRALSGTAADVAEKVFDAISRVHSLPPPTRYEAATLAEMLNMEVRERWPMPALELKRTGANRLFADERDAWIDMALIGAAEA